MRHYNIVTIQSRRLSGEQRITNATTMEIINKPKGGIAILIQSMKGNAAIGRAKN
jgi:hypothetical protein